MARHVDVWRTAWADRRALAPVVALKGRELEFLPAVMEVQDAPPSPVGRAVGGTIIAVFLSGIIWSSVGHIDIIAVAQGKIIPGGHSKVIQPLESGVVRAIHVRDGQKVKKGDVLIELDPTATGADQARVSNEYRAARLEAARLRAVIAGNGVFETQQNTDPKLLAVQQQRLRVQLAEHRARVDAARHQVDQRVAAVGATKADIERLEATVPLLTTRANGYKQLLTQDMVSQMEYLEAEKARIDEVQQLAGQRHKLVQDLAALDEARKNYQVVVAEFQQTRHAELSDQETKMASLAQDVIKAGQRTELQTLVAPIDGEVQQLAVFTVGGVVTPAQQLLVVVPREHQLEVEAMIENKDIGFVEEGQPVEIKVETFPFTRYGTIEGKVLTVSDDAVPLDKGDKGDKGVLVYSARVLMSRSTLMVEGKQVTLSPGMNVTVEIKTGTRRLIEFFLSPLLKSVQETARER